MIVNSQIDRRDNVTYTIDIEEDDIPVRGNAMASDDDALDRRVENAILRRLRNGDIWAWAQVTVTARRGPYEGVDYLGCCCYRNTRDFIRGGYYQDMKRESKRMLLESEHKQ